MRALKHFVALAVATSIATSSLAFGAGIDPAKAAPVQREQAQARFLKGRTFYLMKKYDEALTELRASMEIVESPNTRLFIARCLRDMGRIVAAYVEFGRTEVEAKEMAPGDPRYAKAAASAAAERKELAAKLGFVVITVTNATDDTKLIVGGEEVRRAGWDEPAPVVAGETEVVVETPGKPPVKKKVTVAAGGKGALTIDANEAVTAPVTSTTTETPPPPPPTPEAPSDRTKLRPYAYVAGAVGVAGFLTFAVFGVMSNSKYHDLEGGCGSGPCPSSRSDDISKGKSYQTIANIGLVVGIVGAAAGVTLFVLSTPKSTTTTEVALTPTGFALRGAF